MWCIYLKSLIYEEGVIRTSLHDYNENQQGRLGVSVRGASGHGPGVQGSRPMVGSLLGGGGGGAVSPSDPPLSHVLFLSQVIK